MLNNVSAMPLPVSLSGPELIPDAIHRLGVPKLGMAALHEAAVLLRKHLDL